jgi:hypothetical protein
MPKGEVFFLWLARANSPQKAYLSEVKLAKLDMQKTTRPRPLLARPGPLFLGPSAETNLWPAYALNGFSSGTPSALKSATFLVTIVSS